MNKMYLYPTDGLCNRMRAMDSAISLSSKLNRNLCVIWNKNANLNCAFNELFESIEGIDIKETSSSNSLIPGLKLNPYPKMNPDLGETILSKIRRFLWNRQKAMMKIRGELFYDELLKVHIDHPVENFSTTVDHQNKIYKIILSKIEQSLHGNFSNFIVSCWRLYPDTVWYKHFSPVKLLQRRIDVISNEFQDTIGLHVRRTDHKAAIKNSGLNKFVEKMREEIKRNEKVTFFLATDDEETERVLFDEFKNRIIINKKSSFSRNRKEGIEDALVDLYCLSKTKKIYGSFSSSFSQVAADISRIEVETIC